MNLILAGALLRRMATCLWFPHSGEGMVVFPIQRAIPSTASAKLLTRHDFIASVADHAYFSCTPGLSLPNRGECAIFPGSIGPAGAYLEKALEGRARAGRILPGRHVHGRGHHRNSLPGGHRASWRMRDDAGFQSHDPMDFGRDNIPAAHGPERRGFFGTVEKAIPGPGKVAKQTHGRG